MLSPNDLAASITAAAIAFAEGKSVQDITSFTFVLRQFSDTLLTIASQRTLIEKSQQTKKNQQAQAGTTYEEKSQNNTKSNQTEKN